MEKSNGERFIASYNKLVQALKNTYDLKPAMGFSEVVRKLAPLNSVVKKYEDKLIEFGRLRNAIVHGAGDEIIAEPNIEIVEELEQITRLITTPPRVLDVLPKREVYSCDGDSSLASVCKKMYESGYSIVPVYLKKTLVGVINRKMIVDAIGGAVSTGLSVDALLKQPVASSLEVLNVSVHYEVAPSSITIDSILFMFQQNRKLSTVVITQNGEYTEQAMAVVVTSDTIDLQAILDNY